jgi:hypothetical protein
VLKEPSEDFNVCRSYLVDVFGLAKMDFESVSGNIWHEATAR